MKIIQSYVTENDCYKGGRTITPKGLMLHSVGCSQPKASVFIRQWNKPGVEVCVHGFIEPNGDVYQTLPWNRRAWHCASGPKGSANNTHIGVEMTEPATIHYSGGASWTDSNPAATRAHVLGTYRTAVELFAYLCRLYKLNPLADGVIISHHEGNVRGVASNHGDVEHIWNKEGLTMDGFRRDVYSAMNGSSSQPETPAPEAAPGEQKQTAYRVRITATSLRIRSGPGTNYAIACEAITPGVYTIVAESAGTGSTNGWGKLKSGAGWVALDYCKKI